MLDVFLNYACQAKCPFCFNPPLTPELVRWKLPLDRLAAELLLRRGQGYQGVTFSGGEVTLLRDLPKMLRLSRKAGYSPIGIITNGLRLASPGYVRELADSGLGFCCVSIHGPGPELHDRMVGLVGAFAKVLRALAGLKGLGVPVVLNHVLTRENFRAVPEFVERFAGQAGIVELQLYFPHYEGLMAQNGRDLRVSAKEAGPYLAEAFLRAQSLGARDKLWVYNIPPCALPELRQRLRNWEKEETSLLIDPQGISGEGFQQERRARFKAPACEGCALDRRCLGFETAYVRLYGEGVIRPL